MIFSDTKYASQGVLWTRFQIFKKGEPMKAIVIFTIALLLSPIGEKQTLTDNEHIKVELQSPEKISASKSGEVAFLFSPIEDIHINTIPIFEFRLDKNSLFEIVGNPRFQKNEKKYLDIAKPIEFSIKAKKGTKPGKQMLKGKLNYFYCSDKEGWCNRFTQPVEVSIEVTK